LKKNRVRMLAVMVFGTMLALGLTGFKPPTLSNDAVLVLDVSGEVPEYVPFNPLWGFFQPTPTTMLDKIMLLDKAAADKKIKALVVAVRDNGLGFAKAQELRNAIVGFRKSGKPAVCYMEVEGDPDVSYYLASACEKVYAAPAAFLTLNGLSSSYYFLGGFFEKIKVSVQVVKIKEYKTAGDMLVNKEMSAFHREMAESMLNSLWDQYLAGISASRTRSKDDIIKTIDAAPVLPEKYQQAGLIDGVKYFDEIIAGFKSGDKEAEVVNERQYSSVPAESLGVNVGPKVAVVYGVGNIVTQDPGGSPFRGVYMSSEKMVKEFETLAKDDSIKAVIFRIDSGGGSALASDLIWRATQELRKKKPLVVSMGDVAASGGYYAACGADAIVAQPGTITGSIGVVNARFGAKDLLAWLKVGTATLGKGAYSEIDDFSRPWTDAELAKSQEGIEGVYQLFLDRVSQGRKMSKEDINKIGRGRVWTGVQAKQNGLVDELGGMDKAVEIVKGKLGAKDINLVYKRKPLSLWKLLMGRVDDELVETAIGPEGVKALNLLRLEGIYKTGERLTIAPTFQVE
jgi:protease IV